MRGSLLVRSALLLGVVGARAGAQVPFQTIFTTTVDAWATAWDPVNQYNMTLPGCSAVGFGTAAISCTYNGGAVDAITQGGNGASFSAVFSGFVHPESAFTAYWDSFQSDAVQVTGPVAPSSLVFYSSVLHGQSDGGVGGACSLTFLGYDRSTGQDWYRNVCGYTGGESSFAINTGGSAPFRSGTTYTYSKFLNGIDAWDANGHSLAETDQFFFASGQGTYFVGNPASTVPEPSSFLLLGTGLVGLVPVIRRRKKAS